MRAAPLCDVSRQEVSRGPLLSLRWLPGGLAGGHLAALCLKYEGFVACSGILYFQTSEAAGEGPRPVPALPRGKCHVSHQPVNYYFVQDGSSEPFRLDGGEEEGPGDRRWH